jgi:hypothetical protein
MRILERSLDQQQARALDVIPSDHRPAERPTSGEEQGAAVLLPGPSTPHRAENVTKAVVAYDAARRRIALEPGQLKGGSDWKSGSC